MLLQMDVHDCHASLQTAIRAGLIDAARVVVTGGSHGGFLTGHMVGQYPDMFRAAAMRNPVLNIPLMVHVCIQLLLFLYLISPCQPQESNGVYFFKVFSGCAAQRYSGLVFRGGGGVRTAAGGLDVPPLAGGANSHACSVADRAY